MRSSEKNITPIGDLTLTLAQAELPLIAFALPLSQPTQICIPQLRPMSLSLTDQLLSKKSILLASKLPLRLLALNFDFSSKYESPSEALFCLTAMHSSD